MTLESFLEPNKQVDILPATQDVIQQIHVKEGEAVDKGQLLITLDLDILQASHETAKVLAETKGRLEAARINVKMRKSLVENLQRLQATGHVRPKELDKVKNDLAKAQAELLTVQEEKKIRQKELKQIEAQISKKKIIAPIAGIILRVNKEEGELVGVSVSGGENLLTIVQLQPLHATFHVPYGFAEQFEKDAEVALEIDGLASPVVGKISFMSPTVNPESGTVRIRVDLPESFITKSGIRCRLHIETTQ